MTEVANTISGSIPHENPNYSSEQPKIINNKMNILAVGAHPDDVEIGCGGSLAKHIERGDNVFILIMTNGEQGNHSQHREECMLSLSRLGIYKNNIHFGNFPDCSLPVNHHSVKVIEKLLEKHNIQRVYTHFSDDRHQDHRHCSQTVSSAARKTPEIFLFQGPSTRVPFEPHYIIELEHTHLQKKIDALTAYQTQITKGIVDLKWIKNLAYVNGMPNNVEHAEAFAINHLLKRKDEI